MKYEITKEFVFDSAHCLSVKDILEHVDEEKSRQVYGLCHNVHGHTYRLFVTVGSEALQNGMVINFSELKSIINDRIIKDVDHQVLNDVVWLLDCEPTCENMLERIWSRLVDRVMGDVKLLELKLYETPTSYGVYKG